MNARRLIAALIFIGTVPACDGADSDYTAPEASEQTVSRWDTAHNDYADAYCSCRAAGNDDGSDWACASTSGMTDEAASCMVEASQDPRVLDYYQCETAAARHMTYCIESDDACGFDDADASACHAEAMAAMNQCYADAMAAGVEPSVLSACEGI